MNVVLLLGKIVSTVGRDGVSATFRKVCAFLRRGRVADEFDVRYGVDTSGIEPLWKLKIRSRNARYGARYQPTGEQGLEEAVNFLNEDPQTLIFIDLGCGKGRTLLVASKLGFKKIIGVEFAHELVLIARENLSKRGVVNADVIFGDAADFEFPNDNFVLFLYNPFSHEVMKRVIANLTKSRARRVFVMYAEPVCADVLDSSKLLTRLGCPPGRNIPIWTAAR